MDAGVTSPPHNEEALNAMLRQGGATVLGRRRPHARSEGRGGPAAPPPSSRNAVMQRQT